MSSVRTHYTPGTPGGPMQEVLKQTEDTTNY